MDDIVAKFNNFSFTYNGSSQAALKGIDLEIKRGEFLLLTGKSGCGKSTLALTLAGFIPYAYQGKVAGELIIKDKTITELSPENLAGVVGLVQQEPDAQFCTFKVWEEAAFGPENLCLEPAKIKTRVDEALKNVDIFHLYERDIATLSGGEKQRLAIAAILTMEPELFILDEPTANLDPRGTKQVIATIQNLRRKKNITFVVIEHRLQEFLPLADRVIVMEKGEVAAESSRKYYRNKKSQQRVIKKRKESIQKETPLLSIVGWSVSLDKKQILKDINLQVYPGERIAIMGNNGSGKTTLLFSLLGLYEIEEGKIFYKGREITALRAEKRARFMGLVFQNPNQQILERTVYKEAFLAASFLAPAPSVVDVDKLLKEYSLIEYREQTPFNLSLGEKKRLTLVSSLAYMPDLLLLDEPLAGQDEENVQLLRDTLANFSQRGGAVLMVCHNPEFILENFERVLFLDKGNLVFDTTPQKAFEHLKKMNLTEFTSGCE